MAPPVAVCFSRRARRAAENGRSDGRQRQRESDASDGSDASDFSCVRRERCAEASSRRGRRSLGPATRTMVNRGSRGRTGSPGSLRAARETAVAGPLNDWGLRLDGLVRRREAARAPSSSPKAFTARGATPPTRVRHFAPRISASPRETHSTRRSRPEQRPRPAHRTSRPGPRAPRPQSPIAAAVRASFIRCGSRVRAAGSVPRAAGAKSTIPSSSHVWRPSRTCFETAYIAPSFFP